MKPTSLSHERRRRSTTVAPVGGKWLLVCTNHPDRVCEYKAGRPIGTSTLLRYPHSNTPFPSRHRHRTNSMHSRSSLFSPQGVQVAEMLVRTDSRYRRYPAAGSGTFFFFVDLFGFSAYELHFSVFRRFDMFALGPWPEAAKQHTHLGACIDAKLWAARQRVSVALSFLAMDKTKQHKRYYCLRRVGDVQYPFFSFFDTVFRSP